MDALELAENDEDDDWLEEMIEDEEKENQLEEKLFLEICSIIKEEKSYLIRQIIKNIGIEKSKQFLNEVDLNSSSFHPSYYICLKI